MDFDTLDENLQQCSGNVGGDPASGCDELVGPDSLYCPRHKGY